MAQGGSHMEIRRPVCARIVVSLLVVTLGGLLGDCRPALADSSVAVAIFGTVDGAPEGVYVSGVARITSRLMKTGAKFKHPRSVMLSIDLHDVSGQGLSTGAAYVTESQEDVMRPLVASDQVEITRSEEHTSELQSRLHLVCRLLLEKKKKKKLDTK